MSSEQVNWLIAKQLSQGNKGLRKCKFSDPQSPGLGPSRSRLAGTKQTGRVILWSDLGGPASDVHWVPYMGEVAMTPWPAAGSPAPSAPG